MEENADAKEGGGQRWTLTPKKRVEKDAGVKEDGGARQICGRVIPDHPELPLVDQWQDQLLLLLVLFVGVSRD